ncbi:hypothetical protein AZE42_10071 [Rhizopogon vesiculosus]|uniref:Vesicular-fusion protein SEC18 n=1 Tax=Rhizopogon vesiculosus TaxID=180088 RepID=A0A1J8PP55_9AGAM|nr:hypothetical protein AZE42_10071 [Rhizopogon vesiculosus]
MAFFSRSSQPSPSPSYSSVPARDPRSMARPPPPQPQYNDPSASLFEKRSYDRKPPPLQSGPGMSYQVVSTPNEGLALKNCLVVHPSDFQPGMHVAVRRKEDRDPSQRDCPMTTCHDTSGTIRPGTVAIGLMQRQWIGLSLSGDVVTIDLYPQEPPYLQSIDVQVGFVRKASENQVAYSADEISSNFIKTFNNVIFAPGEMLTFDFKGEKLKMTVTSMGLVDLPDNQNRSRSGKQPQMEMGIVMSGTDVNIMKAGDSMIKIKSSSKKAASNAIIAPNFKFEEMGIGGLDEEFGAIFRRAFASRVFPPALVEKLGIQHVKGILLHGPPGTGKTLIARQIGKMLNAREPKIVNGPEILNKFVGQSEENIRKLFSDAEKEYKEKGDESGLHIIIFDELDAIFKQRGSTNSGTGVGDSVVNQLLSKMDGIDQLNNILVIGMTNRIDMIDEALLRPGRLEVHMEISLPDEHGRYQILRIHTAKMRTNKVMDGDVDLAELAALMKNYSGAEIEGFVKSATSFAFNRHVKVGTMAGISEDVDKLRVNRSDFFKALEEIKPAYGVSEEELTDVIANGIIHHDTIVEEILEKGKLFVNQVARSTRTPRVSILLHGPPASGKTVLAASIAWASQFPFIKLISPDRMVGFSEAQKIQFITRTFTDSYKSPMSVIVVDNLERLLDWTSLGSRFSNPVLQTLLVLIARKPPKDKRLLVIATTSLRPLLTELGLSDVFDSELRVPPISNLSSLEVILREVQLFPSERELQQTIRVLADAGFAADDNVEHDAALHLQVGIKKLLSIIEMARQEPERAGERLVSAIINLNS